MPFKEFAEWGLIDKFSITLIIEYLIINHIRKKQKAGTDTRSILPAFTFSVLSDNIYK